ncbi:MAG TPA: pitrilysin family protein [Pyrinomonadaceae bacterium]|jgi:zinc protease|nr:pitrilysin family protein [Pyrinomonadaceae bacterium]
MRIIKKRSNVIVAMLLIALVSSLAFAQQGSAPMQQPQTTKGAVIKGKAPVNKEVLKVKLPRAQEATLKNGLQVILLESHKIPTFNMQLVVLSGGLSDKADYRGLASFTAALLREGTSKRSSKDIAEQVDALGATLTANAGLSSMTSTVNTSGLIENLDQTLGLFADVIRNPTFPQAEVDKYKTRTLAQLQFQRSIPQFLAAEQFQRAIYGANHPAALVAPPAESLKKLTSKDLAEFHSTYYRPNNAMIAIVGDVTMKQILPKLEKAFGDWEKGTVPAQSIPPAPAQADARIYLIDRPGSVQTVLQLGTLGIERTSPDYFAVLLADRVLGGGPSGRLFLNLREDKGYTYGAYSNFGGSKFKGTWTSSSEVRTDVTEGAMKEFMYELNRLRNDVVPAEELDNAKRAIIGSFALSLEQPNALLQNIITQKLYNLPADYWDTYPQKVSAITAADVQRAAQKYIDLGHLQVVAVGDAAKAREVLAKYGKVELYDADGKPVAGSENNNK